MAWGGGKEMQEPWTDPTTEKMFTGLKEQTSVTPKKGGEEKEELTRGGVSHRPQMVFV